jgi:hypothetical protein
METVTKTEMEDFQNAVGSEFMEVRKPAWDDSWGYAIPDAFGLYRDLFALGDFWCCFHDTPQFKAKFSDNLESFGRFMGFDWVFDFEKAPKHLIGYMDLLHDGPFLTMVPEGVFGISEEAGISFMSWEGFIEMFNSGPFPSCNNPKDSDLERFRWKELMGLLEHEVEVYNLKRAQLMGESNSDEEAA